MIVVYTNKSYGYCDVFHSLECFPSNTRNLNMLENEYFPSFFLNRYLHAGRSQLKNPVLKVITEKVSAVSSSLSA